nr:MAG TPA: hypothetical protein [Caudoviricetes sp.]
MLKLDRLYLGGLFLTIDMCRLCEVKDSRYS